MPLETYILDENGQPVREPNLDRWWIWFGTDENRVLRQDDLPGGISVSTVFLGLDHRFGRGPPVLWETIIFGGTHDQYQERYISREAALKGHDAAVALAKGHVS
jgi:hypothetical protein